MCVCVCVCVGAIVRAISRVHNTDMRKLRVWGGGVGVVGCVCDIVRANARVYTIMICSICMILCESTLNQRLGV